MEKIKEVLAKMRREELEQTIINYATPNKPAGGDKQKECQIAHAGQCGVCDGNGNFTPCP